MLNRSHGFIPNTSTRPATQDLDGLHIFSTEALRPIGIISMGLFAFVALNFLATPTYSLDESKRLLEEAQASLQKNQQCYDNLQAEWEEDL